MTDIFRPFVAPLRTLCLLVLATIVCLSQTSEGYVKIEALIRNVRGR